MTSKDQCHSTHWGLAKLLNWVGFLREKVYRQTDGVGLSPQLPASLMQKDSLGMSEFKARCGNPFSKSIVKSRLEIQLSIECFLTITETWHSLPDTNFIRKPMKLRNSAYLLFLAHPRKSIYSCLLQSICHKQSD